MKIIKGLFESKNLGEFSFPAAVLTIQNVSVTTHRNLSKDMEGKVSLSEATSTSVNLAVYPDTASLKKGSNMVDNIHFVTQSALNTDTAIMDAAIAEVERLSAMVKGDITL